MISRPTRLWWRDLQDGASVLVIGATGCGRLMVPGNEDFILCHRRRVGCELEMREIGTLKKGR
ncbi:hypothetical protein [Nonomuraea jabiensis]|uniref:hypothetical protein n=1 Tax=Nonomuraea jabiensis TaxID=882448 RepID=UPI0036B3D18C